MRDFPCFLNFHFSYLVGVKSVSRQGGSGKGKPLVDRSILGVRPSRFNGTVFERPRVVFKWISDKYLTGTKIEYFSIVKVYGLRCVYQLHPSCGIFIYKRWKFLFLRLQWHIFSSLVRPCFNQTTWLTVWVPSSAIALFRFCIDPLRNR